MRVLLLRLFIWLGHLLYGCDVLAGGVQSEVAMLRQRLKRAATLRRKQFKHWKKRQ